MESPKKSYCGVDVLDLSFSYLNKMWNEIALCTSWHRNEIIPANIYTRDRNHSLIPVFREIRVNAFEVYKHMETIASLYRLNAVHIHSLRDLRKRRLQLNPIEVEIKPDLAGTGAVNFIHDLLMGIVAVVLLCN